MIPASLVIFAIQAGVQLGQKSYEIMVDKDFDRPLRLPMGDSLGEEAENVAKEFFQIKANQHWIDEGGPYEKLKDEDGGYVKAYQAITGIDLNQAVGQQSLTWIVEFDQEKKSKAPTVQRLLATVVDIGIDFFKTNTVALGLGSSAQKIITAFVPVVENINKTLKLDENNIKEFDKRQIPDIAGKVLTAGLQVLGDNKALISRDQGVQNLLGGVTHALVDDFNQFKDLELEKKSGRLEFYDRVSSSLLRGAMTGFAENPTLLIRGKSGGADCIRETLTQVFKGLETQTDFITNESLEIIFKNALLTVSEKANLITKEKIIQSFLQGTVGELITKQTSKDIFSEGTVTDIMKIGLETLGNNVSTLIDPKNPQRKFLDETVAALATSLSSTLGGEKLGKLFSSKQMIALSQIVFQEVAKNPEHLLGYANNNPEKTGLAQIIASVARSLGDDPRKLITGDGALELLRTAMKTGMQNADTLLRLDTTQPTDNLLYQLLHETVQPMAKKMTPANLTSLINRQVIADTAKQMLVTTANNLTPFMGGKATQVRDLIQIMLDLATEKIFSARLNAGNFVPVFDMLLRKLLLGQLDPTKKETIITALEEALQSLL